MSSTTTPKGASDFVADLAAGKPVLQDLLDALATNGATKTVDDVLKQDGYQFTAEELQAAVAAVQSGKNFDIRTVAGIYKFTEPADMANSKMEVVPTSSKIYIDNTSVDYKIDDQGQVVWSSSGNTYTITFEIRYNDDGSPKPIAFEGTRQDSDKNSVVVKGEQKLPEAHWTSAEWALTIAWIATIFGTGFGVVVWAIDRFKKKQPTQDVQNRVNEAAARAASTVQEVADDATTPLISLEDFQEDTESAISESVYHSLQSIPDAGTANINQTREAAGSAGASQLRELVAEAIGPSVSTKFDAYVRYSRSNDTVDVITNSLADKVLESTRSSFASASSYIEDIVEASIQQYNKEQSRRDAQAFQTAAAQDAQDVQDYQTEVAQKGTAKATRVAELKQEGASDDQIAQDQEVKRLSKEIQDAEENERKSEQSRADNEGKGTTADNNAKEAEQKRQEAKQRADAEAKSVYREGH